MTGLPWARLDSNIATHDKILALLADPSPKRWQAAFNYPCSIAWSVGQGTDGHVPASALGMIHATQATARLLVKYGLWRENGVGYLIPNFAERQQVVAVTEAISQKRSDAGRIGACHRHHRQPCRMPGCQP